MPLNLNLAFFFNENGEFPQLRTSLRFVFSYHTVQK